MILVTLYLSYFMIAIALLTSLTVYIRPTTSLYLKIFPIFLTVILIIGLRIGYLSSHYKSNIGFYNLFTTIAFIFYFFSLQQIIVNKKVKRIIVYIAFIYPLITLLNIFWIQTGAVFNTITFSLGCLLIVMICIYYFLELFQLTSSINLLTQPSFWICSGLLFYFSCSFPLLGLVNFLKSPSKIIGNSLAIISNLLDVLLYSSFTIAFLCRIKIRKSMSSS